MLQYVNYREPNNYSVILLAMKTYKLAFSFERQAYTLKKNQITKSPFSHIKMRI